MPSAPDWLKKPTRPRPGTVAASVAFSRTAGSVLATPEAVRADDPQPVRAGDAHQLVLPGPPLGAGLAEPRGDHDQPAHPLLRALLHHVDDPVGRYGEDGEVHLPVDGRHARVGPHPGDGPRLAVHGIDRSGEVGAEQVAQHGLTDAARLPARSDDRHRTRREQPLDRAGLGPVLAGGGHLLGGLRRGEVEGHPDHAVGEAALRGVADLFEHRHHLLVGGQHVGDEPGDPPFSGGRGQVFEKYRGDPTALVGVLDEEGDLGLSGSIRS